MNLMTQQRDVIKTLTGVWHNQHHSQINLVVHEDGHLTGTFRSGVGPANQESCEFPLTGFAKAGIVSFCVDFGKHDSMTAWVGQIVDGPEPGLEMMWQMIMNTHQDRSKSWKSVLTGADTFSRSQYKKQKDLGTVSHPVWCGIDCG